MKRGNTALKRGVAIAAAFTTAIAGAVLAAPAANAATLTPAAIRATPIADAWLINGDALAEAIGEQGAVTATYGAASVTTGAVDVIGVGSNQSVSNFQVVIPAGAAGTAAWTKNDTFTVALSAEATFASAPTVTISSKPVLLTGSDQSTPVYALDGVTGVSDTAKQLGVVKGHAADALAAVGVADLPKPNKTVTATVNDDGELVVKFAEDDVNAAILGTGYGYLLNFTGVKVNVSNRAAPGALSAGTGGGSTTLAYVSPFQIATVGDATYPTTVKGDIPLPDVKVTETSVNGIAAAGQHVVVAVDGTRTASATPVTFTADATVTPSSKLDVGSGPGKEDVADGHTDATVQDTDGSGDNTRIDSFVLSDLKVAGAVAGKDITLTVVGDLGSAVESGGFSHSAGPAADGVSVTISADSDSQRLAGTNRYDTAAKIAKNYAKAATVNAVILANGLDAKQGIDALSASFLAGAVSAPVLLTSSGDALPAETADALKTIFEDSAGDAKGNVTVYVLGKTDSVSAKAAEQAQSVIKAAANAGLNAVNIVRLDGDNRYDTAAKVAAAGSDEINTLAVGTGTAYNTAFLASGKVNADALAAGVLAAKGGYPVLLNDGDTLNDAAAKLISDENIKQIIVLGGTDRVSAALVTSLTEDHGVKNVVRIAGVGAYGRYNTAALLAQFAVDNGIVNPGSSNVYVANGAGGFADALAVGPYAALGENFVVTVPTTLLPDLTKGFLTANKGDIDLVTAVGGPDRVTAAVIKAAEAAVGL